MKSSLNNLLGDVLLAAVATVLAGLGWGASMTANVIGGAGHFASKLLEGLALGLGNEEGSKDTAQHEESENLHNVVNPWRGGLSSRSLLGASSSERSEHDLGNDGSDFARSSGETVGSGTVAGREAFTGNDECGSIRA